MSFLRENGRFFAFGFALTFLASFGQTFFISLFGAEFRAAFSLSHGSFGAIYSGATLASAAVLVWLGRLIDGVELRLYTLCAFAGLAGAAFLMAGAGGVAWFALAIFGLRLSGQGLLSHIAQTSMARYFDHVRGRALSVAMLGAPAGEAVFPAVAVALIVAMGWREAWAAIGAILVLIAAPLVLFLLKGHGARHDRHLAGLAQRQREAGGERESFTRGQVLRDPRFYLLMPGMLAFSFVITGLFIHQVYIAETKGWAMALVARAFVVYALVTVPASFGAGYLADRIGAYRLVPVLNLGIIVALAVLAMLDGGWSVYLYMGAAAVNAGFNATIPSALWAELYGVRHLGSIRALIAAVMVLASALSPALFGWLYDAGVVVETLSLWLIAFLIGASALAFVALRGIAPVRAAA